MKLDICYKYDVI